VDLNTSHHPQARAFKIQPKPTPSQSEPKLPTTYHTPYLPSFFTFTVRLVEAKLHIIHLITNYSFPPHTNIQPFPHDARPFSSILPSHPFPKLPESLDSGKVRKKKQPTNATPSSHATQCHAENQKTQRKSVKLPPLSGVTHPLKRRDESNPPHPQTSSSADSVRHSQL
jgi:hypothetical protein